MRTFGLGRIRRAARRARNRMSRRVIILMYHRVAEQGSDPWSLSVTPQHFGEHLAALNEFGRMMRMDQLAAAIRGGNLPRRAVVVTFDDGYADNLLIAKPLLEKHHVPSTVFVTTGVLGAEREFWWDELEKVFLQPGSLPRTLSLTASGSRYEWHLGELPYYDLAACQDNLGWKAWDKNAPSPRHSAYRSIWELMHPLPEAERQKVRDDILSWAGVEPEPRSTHRTLTADEIERLAFGGLVEIGCHTVTHPRLSALSAALQRDELFQSKVLLEKVLGRAVSSFAYPYGRRSDYTQETVALAREVGFDSACTTSQGVVSSGSDLFELPRFQAPNVAGDTFSHLLRQWFDSER